MGLTSTLVCDVDVRAATRVDVFFEIEPQARSNGSTLRLPVDLPPVMKVMTRGDVRPMTGVAHYSLPTGEGDTERVEFDGELLAQVSSREEYGDRSRFWREIAVYRSVGGGYVVQSIGATSVPGKTTRNTVTMAPDADAVYDILAPAGQRPRTIVADLFEELAKRDHTFISAVGDRLDVEDLEGPVGTGHVVELPRENDRWLRFHGERLAHESSRVGDAPSWTEIEIYRTGGPRYVVFKAQQFANESEPSHATVKVVEDGRAALEALIRPGVTWIESAALAALAQASDRDPHFEETIGDLLYEDNFRGLLPEVPKLSATQRSILQRLAGGARLVTERLDEQRSRVTGWVDAPDAPIPIWQIFLKLSRQRLVRRVRDPAIPPGRDEWEISNFGRAALRGDQR